MENSIRPRVIMNMNIRPPWIRRYVRENSRSCWRAASYGTYRSPFTNFRSSFCTFSNASAARDRTGCLSSIFKMWPDTHFVQDAKHTGVKGREGSFQAKKHSTGFTGSADDIIVSNEFGV